LSFYLIQLVLQ